MFSVQCNSSTGLIENGCEEIKNAALAYLLKYSRMTMQSNLYQARPSLRSSDVPALCIFNQNRQGNQILKEWAILLIQRKGIAENIYCMLSGSFICQCPCDMVIKKNQTKPKQHSVLYHTPVSKFCGLMTGIYFALCFQMKLMT